MLFVHCNVKPCLKSSDFFIFLPYRLIIKGMNDYSIIIHKPLNKEIPDELRARILEIGQDSFRIHIERGEDGCEVTPSKCELCLGDMKLQVKYGVEELEIPARVAEYLGCDEYADFFSFC